MKKRFLILYFFISISVFVNGQPLKNDVPLIRNYSYKDYKASPQNWNIAQDKHGVMYFANDYGVLDFDGNTWKINGLSSRVPPRSIAIDGSENVFVGGYGDFGQLRRNGNGTMDYHSLKPAIETKYQNFEDVWNIYPTSEGVFFCTSSAVYKYYNGKITVHEIPGRQQAMSFHIHNKLYVTVQGSGIFEFRAEKLVLIPNSAQFSQSQVMAMMAADHNKMMIVTQQQGIFEYDGFTSFKPWPNRVSAWLGKNRINTAIAINDGYVLGSVRDGLIIVDREGIPRQHLNREKGLQNNAVQSLYQDNEGNLWIATNKGIDYVQINSPFSFLNAKSGLPGIGYSSLLYEGKTYWCTSEGLYMRSPQESPDFPDASSFHLVENTQGIAYNIQLINGQLLLSHHNGPYLVEGDRAVKISDHNGAWLFKTLKKHPGYVLCGTYTGLLLYKIDGEKLIFQRKIDGFSESSRIMEEDQEGNIWIAHGYKGLYKIQFKDDLSGISALNFYGARSGFPGNLYINVFMIDNKPVFTAERGVFRYDKNTNRFVPHEILGKLFEPDKHIRKLVEDREGNIWFSAGDQMGYLKKTLNGGYSLEKNIFNPLQGSLVGGFEYFGFHEIQEVVIGTEEGFVLYHSNQVQQTKSSHEFYTLIRNVVCNDGKKDSLLFGGYALNPAASGGDSSTQIPYASNSMKFVYSAASYANMERLQYQFFLEGFDKSWSDWTLATTKEYTNLRESNYTFHVRARDIYGKESAEAAYAFSISPPWYRSVYAYIFYVLLLAATAYQSRKILIIRDNKTKLRLKEEQDKAMRLKEAEYNETVLKAEKEIIKLNSEKLSTELEHKNKELASSAMHIMKRHDSNEKIREQLDQINDKMEDKTVSYQLRQIIKSLQEDVLFDNNWDQFELHFNQIHHDFLHRLREGFPQLIHSEIKLLAYIRMDLSSKEIASLMNLSIRSIENNRYRIRKKMGLEQTVNLSEFILRY